MIEHVVTALRWPLFWTRSENLAQKLPFQFSKDGTHYVTSSLGIINGILPTLTGRVLVAVVDDKTGKGVRLQLQPKWW